MKRVFIAIKIILDEDSLAIIQTLKSQLSTEKIKWVEDQNHHLTLHFFGDISDSEIESTKTILKKVSHRNSFELKIEGLSTFSRNGIPNIVFAKISASKDLKALNIDLQNELSNAGFSVRKGEYKPHLTLGRIKRVNDQMLMNDVLFDLRNCYFQTCSVNSITLFESELTPTGPIYSALEKFEFE